MDVGAWLKEFGFEVYAETFEQNGVDADLLRELTNDDLKDLGVAKLADRKRLLKSISITFGPNAGNNPANQPHLAETGERRPVTVLFVDLVSFTRLSSDRDAEEIHSLLNRYFETVDGLVHDYGGKVDKHIGDAVMALFGAPVAHTDDPYRATLAAHKIQEAMGQLSEELGEMIQAHAGIALGQVVASDTGSARHSEYTVIGDSVNLASRLTDLASPGEILISKAVHDAVSRDFVCVSRGEEHIKGLDQAVSVWCVEGLGQVPSDSARGKFVGRRVELRQFEELLREACDHSHGHTLLVRGEPGIGKTRLREEFLDIAGERDFECHTCLVMDFGTGRGQTPVQELVQSFLRIPKGAGEVARATAAEAALSDGLLSQTHEVFANALLDVHQPPKLQNVYDAMDNATRIEGQRDCVVSILAAKAASCPQMVVVEDVHWADDATFHQLSKIATAVADLPVLLVITSRLEGPANEQNWLEAMRGAPFVVLELQPLRAKETLELAQHLAEEESETLQALIARAEGNPLFVEQLVRGAVDTLDDNLPDTVQGIVLARMDRLSKRNQEGLRAASVLGQRFDLEALRALVDDADFDCGILVQHRLVRPDETGLIFAHALVREGVYGSLLSARRKTFHRRAADWYSSRDPYLYAEHLERAGDPEAARAYVQAAEIERSLYRFERGLELSARAADAAKSDEDKYAISSLRGALFQAVGDYTSAIAAFRDAHSWAADDSDRCRAIIGEGYGLLRTDQHDEAALRLQDSEAIARAKALEPELAQIYRHQATIQFARGNADASFELGERAAQLARKCDIPRLEAEAWSTVADAELGRGRLTEALAAYQRCVDVSRKHGLRGIEVVNLKMQADIMVQMGELQPALENLVQVIKSAEELGDRRALFLAHASVSVTCSSLGRIDEAKTHALRSREIILQLDARRFMMNNNIILADIAVGQGDVKEAKNYLCEAEKVADELGIIWMRPWLLGVRTKVVKSEHERRAVVAEAEALFADGEGTYCRFEFCEAAMEGCLIAGDFDAAEHVAGSLENYHGGRPPGGARFLIERARALASHGRGVRDSNTRQSIQRLREEAAQAGRIPALALLDAADR